VSDRTRPNAFPPAPPKPEPPRTQTPVQGSGFAARLQDASLWDLIQFECMRRSRRIVRVSSRGLLGYVFFRDGDVVHATTGRQNGEAALGEMLNWQDGVFETWTGTWPDRETINTPWQRVLLEVAQAKDEHRAPKLHSIPSRETKPVKEADVVSIQPPQTAAQPLVSVILSPEGKVLRGTPNTDLPEAAAYAVGLADLLGECLGLDEMRSMEAEFETAHYLVGRAADGNIVAARATQAGDLEPLKKELSK
jgi:hypothetical protein